MNDRIYTVYGLICPFTNKIMYVGYTKNPLFRRLGAHLHETYSTRKRLKDVDGNYIYTPKEKWIMSLCEGGVPPKIQGLSSGYLSFEDVKVKEQKLINMMSGLLNTMMSKVNKRTTSINRKPDPNQKLNREKVEFIRSTYKRGVNTHQEIAIKLGVTRELVRDVVNRKKWKHL